MSVMNHDQQPGSGGMGKFLVIGAAVVAVIAAAYFGVTMTMKPETKPEPAPAARTEPAPAPPAAKPAEPEKRADTPTTRRPRPRKAEPAAPEPAAPPPPSGPTLIVESDVPGASVFVDRKFVGTTPLRTSEVTGGSHQLNASSTGEEGLAQVIEIAETGETTITLRFKEVRLNASVAVVHKHGMGSCEGRLIGTTDGLRYDTSNKKDAFAIPFSQLESFEIDYLKKELKVKQKGGKNWNFTDKSDNADKLFVFHRDVTKARERLAAQGK
jgi:hypothetical protein